MAERVLSPLNNLVGVLNGWPALEENYPWIHETAEYARTEWRHWTGAPAPSCDCTTDSFDPGFQGFDDPSKRPAEPVTREKG
ncbi:MAG: hypothetical protein WDN31_02565 [Hyphomicrobium sp.]